MNNTRRKELASIEAQLQDLHEIIDQLKDEEQEGFDNLPESLQQAEKGQAMEEAVEKMGSAADALNEALEAIREAQAKPAARPPGLSDLGPRGS